MSSGFKPFVSLLVFNILKHLTDVPSDAFSFSMYFNGKTVTKTMDMWLDDDYAIITWLLNCCEPSMSADIMFRSHISQEDVHA